MSIIRHKRQRGQALVESALIVVCFVVILIASMDFAQVLFIHQSIVERVRAGLRWGATHAYDEAKIKNVILYSQPTQPAGAQPFLGLNDSNISIIRSETGGSTERLQISIVDFQYHFITPGFARVFTNRLGIIEMLPTEYRP